MPVYDYLCSACGPFSGFMPMAEYEAAVACPECGIAAPRALLSAPHFRTMSATRFTAQAVNEKNAHMPESSARSGRHPPGCGCCKTAAGPQPAAKSFPAARPWMISH